MKARATVNRSKTKKTRNLIIGIGNPLRGDDGIGWHIIKQINNYLPALEDNCFHVQQLSMDLIDPISQVDFVLFVDARLDEIPGKISYKEITQNSYSQSPLSHYFDPETLLAATYVLYHRHPKAGVLTVGVQQIDFTEELSETVKASIPALLEFIKQLFQDNSS